MVSHGGTVEGGGVAESTEYLGATTPPGPIFWDEPTFHLEMERLFYRSWLNVGHESQIAQPGDFFTRQIGPESVLFVRGADGTPRGFYNVCRHRGTRLLEASEGSGVSSIVCPYHSWKYGLDGRLLGAPHTQEVTHFDKEQFGLHPVRVERWGGFLWANLSGSGPSLREEFGTFFAEMARFPIAELRLGAHFVYEVEANWKILVENYSECYHCAPVHPELNRLTPYLSGDNDHHFLEGERRSKVNGGFMTFAKDYTSMTRTGYTGRPLIRGMTDVDKTRVYYHTMFPNTFLSLHPDYLMLHRSWPINPHHSRVECDFFFEPAAVEQPDFDPKDATELWDEINRQDWKVCELAQQGARSRSWRGGRYSDQESLVYDFDAFVREQMRAP
ncbi:MAG: aromatic ring-hydroxylating dioxygenase subunit alpha [Thermoplasmata archaeon]|nr:aromatic ring-hydroxylating dioxygenase subunit alpha [Thermoplasmata archaeon]